MAAGVAADLPRRARLRAQVEHGLDARRARLPAPRAGAPEVPPQPAHVRPALRVDARTSSCRCPTTRSCTARARSSARCPATTGSASRTCACSTGSCGRTRARSSSSWAASSASPREWNHDREPRLAPARGGAVPPRRAGAGGDLNRLYRDEPALHEARPRARRLRVDGLQRRRPERRGVLPLRPAADGGARALRRATSRRSRATAIASACPRGGCVARGPEHRRRALRRQRRGQRGRRRGRGRPVARPAVLGAPHPAAARRRCSCATASA